jgi:hypothetical protein
VVCLTVCTARVGLYLLGEQACPSLGVFVNQDFYFEKIRVFKAGMHCLNTLAWNNRIGRAVLFCWFLESP